MSDEAYRLDSYIVVYNPQTCSPEIYQQAVLPVGSVASVTAFLRCALGIWIVGTRLLKLTWTSYFDDFFSLTSTSLARYTEIGIATLFHILGWSLSEDKLVHFAECCKVLGIELNLTRSLAGLLTVCNAQSRCDELVGSMEEILATKKLTRCDGERLRCRLQFASNQIFGRRFRNCLREFNSHVARGFRTITEELASALALMCQMLRTNQPRLVDTNFLDGVHLYVAIPKEFASAASV